MHRHGALELVLVWPDGTRRLIPSTWTDLEPIQQPEAQSTATLGALTHLLSAGRVVAALCHRLIAAADDEDHPIEEDRDAIAAESAGGSGTAGARSGRVARRRAAGTGRGARAAAPPGRRSPGEVRGW